MLATVIMLTKIGYTCRTTDGVILTRHMIGNEIDDYLHAGRMRTRNERLKLVHAIGHILGKVGVNIIVIDNGIR